MKKILVFFICFSFSFSGINAQNIRTGSDEELASTFRINYMIRVTAERLLKESFKSQQKDYRRILIKSGAIKKMKQTLHEAVYDVSNEIKNGKKVKYFLKVLDEIGRNSEEMLAIASKEYKYYERFTELYNNIMELRENIYKDAEPIFTKTEGVHMDNYDRLELITEMTRKAETVNQEVLQLKSFLETIKMVDKTKNSSPFKNYINKDKEIIEVVMYEYKDKF